MNPDSVRPAYNTEPRALWRLFRVEFYRLALRRRALLAALGLTGLGAYTMKTPLPGSPLTGGVWASANLSLTLGAVLVAVIVAAGAFAADRRSRYMFSVLARGYSRRRFVAAKALAMAASAGFNTYLGLTGFPLIAWLRLPLNEWVMPTFSGFFVPLAMLSLASAALALVGLLAGSASANEYLASASPLLVLIISATLLSNSSYNPASQIDAWQHLRRPAELEFPVYSTFPFWLGFGGLLSLLAGEIFARREQA